MDFIAEFGFDVKRGKSGELQEWLSENESKLAATCPKGIEYVGTYFVVWSSEKHSGGCRQLFRMESYGSQDSWAATMKGGGEFATLMEGMAQFVDQDREADWSQGLYKAVTAASIWGDEA